MLRSRIARTAMSSTKWQELAKLKRNQLQAAIPKEWTISPRFELNVLGVPSECGVLTPKELEITNESDVSVLLHNLATSKWSSVEVTKAFCKRATIAHQMTNCLTDAFFDTAMKRAAELDDYLQRNGEVVGPLHGLPISLKDQYRVKGLDTPMGYASWIGDVAEDDATVVQILREAGAILYVRTNVPQTLMWTETHNNVYGRTVNPHNRALTPGGSTGGEGALLAMHGSVLGIGTDIGGSSRVPAHFCGIYGFKPSYHRLPFFGAVNSLDGQESIATAVGPMSTSMSGLTILTKTVLESKPWRKDPLALRMPWSSDAYALNEHGGGKHLCFGIMWNDGTLTPHPPVIRALKIAKKAVEEAGHTVIVWSPYRHAELANITRAIWTADGGADYRAALLTVGEPLINSMKPDADPHEVVAHRKHREPLTVYDLWQVHKQKRQLRKEYMDLWNSTASKTETGRPIDALICPPAPYAAVPHGQTRSAGYTMVWNALDYPALIVPVTKVDPSVDVVEPQERFFGQGDETLYKIYDPEVFKDAPVGVQLVTQKQEEEALLAIGKVVDDAVRKLYSTGRAIATTPHSHGPAPPRPAL
ncbi:general amidase [Neolentinus lepideus HHB14362 ss-1]|uniref:General amidase n=1 Tax=Neolentinus lepideus HHB14362 ss-1 TaxID=1314782 RepID=A0A165VZ09_9AGAM|nr:general amidase [Neolentinus lepideus HHB14362 ss-1]